MLNEKGIYHFANSNATSWHGFAKEIYRTGLSLGMPFKLKELNSILTKDYPTTAIRPAYSVLSTEKIEKQFQIKPQPWQNALTQFMSIFERKFRIETNSSVMNFEG